MQLPDRWFLEQKFIQALLKLLTLKIFRYQLSLTYCNKEHETGFLRKSFWSTFISSSIDLGTEKSFKQVSAMG